MQKQFGSSNATVFRQILSTVAARHTESDVHAAQATAYVHDYFFEISWHSRRLSPKSVSYRTSEMYQSSFR
jgi:hypothetical protein